MAYDYSKITERVYFEEIKAAGITHIIDAQVERDDDVYLPKILRGLSILWDPTADDGVHPKPVLWFKNCVEYGIAALSIPGSIVLTHCAAGINRGPSLAYAIMRAQGLPSADALLRLHVARPQTLVGVAYREDAEAALKVLKWI